MGKVKSKRSSLKMGMVIRKKAKAKRDRTRKLNKMKQFPKRSKKMLVAPQSLPNREQIQSEVHEGSEFINKILRPIQSEAPLFDKDYDEQIRTMQAEVIAKHQQKVEEARESYQAVLDVINEADVIAEVLDARDPTACRFLEAEGEAISKGKKLIFILNKIDFVPREVVIRWCAFLEQTAPTVAISAVSDAAVNAIQDILARTAPNATKVALIGLPKSGKSTILALNETIFREIPSFTFVAPSPEVALLQASQWALPLYQLACYTIARLQDESFFTCYGIEAKESPEQVIASLADKWECRPKDAARRLMDELWDRTVKWFAVPNDGEWKNISGPQNEALQASLPFDLQIYEYIHIGAGEAVQVDEDLLTENVEEEEDEEEDEQ